MTLGTRSFNQLRDMDADDARRMAYAISQPLHYCTGTPQCKDPLRCPMCKDATRLAVQWYRPVLERRVVETIQSLYGITCQMSHPGSD